MRLKISLLRVVLLVICIPPFALAQYVLDREMKTGTIGIHGGTGIPAGEFSDTSGANAGGAQPGIIIGIDYLYPITDVLELSWITGLSFLYNDARLAPGYDQLQKGGTVTSWIHLTAMIGLRAGGEMNESINLHGAIQSGILWGLSPKIESHDQALNERLDVWQNSGNGWSVAVNGRLNAVLKDHLDLAIGILYGRPTYEVRTVGKEVIVSQEGDIHKKIENFKFTQQTAILTVSIGWLF